MGRSSVPFGVLLGTDCGFVELHGALLWLPRTPPQPLPGSLGTKGRPRGSKWDAKWFAFWGTGRERVPFSFLFGDLWASLGASWIVFMVSGAFLNSQRVTVGIFAALGGWQGLPGRPSRIPKGAEGRITV